ncbi:MAG: hypothetical protein QM817_29460 [Archangium sp.]
MQSTSVVEMFREGGPTMYLIVLLLAFGLTLGVAALLIGKKGPVIGLAVVVALIILTGVGGMMLGRTQTERAIPNVPESMQEELRAKGYAESMRNVQFGGLASLPLVLLAVVGWQRASRS